MVGSILRPDLLGGTPSPFSLDLGDCLISQLSDFDKIADMSRDIFEGVRYVINPSSD